MAKEQMDTENEDPITICCEFVTNVILLRLWRINVECMSNELCKSFCMDWNLPHTVKMSSIASFTSQEDIRRIHRLQSNQDDNTFDEHFEGLQFSVAALHILEKRAAALGWE